MGVTIDVAATAAILGRIRAGDPAAREDLFKRFEAPLLRFLHGRLPPLARGMFDTHDAAQEVCMKVFRTLGSFEPRGVGAFWAYLRNAALNFVRDLTRTPGKWSPGESLGAESRVDYAALSNAPLSKVIQTEDLAAFERSIAVLDERARTALLMRFELDAEYADIAQECGFASPDAARMAVSRAIEKIAAEMARERPKT
jgi:RNA polymerase sigma-70 factor, ECF subfamily